jgi:pyruvate dehydrogenase E2 component (dihydrolipoamide acetyltransferase)
LSDALYAREKGSGRETLVLLHGFGGHWMDWYDIQPDLVREGRVLAYDLPGHGRSLAHPAAGNASGMAKAIFADLDARGISRVHLAGFSMGGAVACLMGLRAADRVASLTLLAPGGFGPEISEPRLRDLAAHDTADALRAAMNAMCAPGFEMPTKNVAALAATHSLPGQQDKLVEIAGKIAKDSRQGEIPREMLAGLAMPVTVVWGTEDPVLPYAQSENLPPRFEFVRVPGAGHMLLEEARKTVIQAIRNTMRRAR